MYCLYCQILVKVSSRDLSMTLYLSFELSNLHQIVPGLLVAHYFMEINDLGKILEPISDHNFNIFLRKKIFWTSWNNVKLTMKN